MDTKTTFWQLLQNNEIEIPMIQRDYAQGRTDGKSTTIRDNFLESLHKALKEKEPLHLDFVYGSTVSNKLQPLDGQQRLTTLFLLHWYAALKAGKLNDEVKQFAKFTYAVRQSSKDFCEKLAQASDMIHEEKKVKEAIIDEPWFYESWLYDPTVSGMLTTLDAIDTKFADMDNLWARLTPAECPITFDYLQLTDFGLSDDLYIKMNARGKALTPFENFKARFEQVMEDRKDKQSSAVQELMPAGISAPIVQKYFSHKIDGEWLECFWQKRSTNKGKTQNNDLCDDELMNFIRTIVTFDYTLNCVGDTATKERKVENEDFKALTDNNAADNLDYRLVNTLIGTPKADNWFGAFIIHLILAFDISCDVNGGWKKYLEPGLYFYDEEMMLNNILNANLTYADRLLVFTYYRYLMQKKVVTYSMENDKLVNSSPELNDEKKPELKDWLRVVYNLAHNTNIPDYIFIRALGWINQMLSNDGPNGTSILQMLKEGEVTTEATGFYGAQIEEEKIKAKLILQSRKNGDGWEAAIYRAEAHGYFKSQIGFLLDFAKYELTDGMQPVEVLQENQLDRFKDYREKAFAIFDSNGLKNFNNQYLAERALLTKPNINKKVTGYDAIYYLMPSGNNVSFLVNQVNTGAPSWRDFLHKYGMNRHERPCLQLLFDDINYQTDNIEEALKKIIDDAKPISINDWRKYFVECQGMLEYYGSNHKCRYLREDGDNCYMLTRERFVKCAELFSYAFYAKNFNGKTASYAPFTETWYYDGRKNAKLLIYDRDHPCATISDFHYSGQYKIALNVYYQPIDAEIGLNQNCMAVILFEWGNKVIPDEVKNCFQAIEPLDIYLDDEATKRKNQERLNHELNAGHSVEIVNKSLEYNNVLFFVPFDDDFTTLQKQIQVFCEKLRELNL